MTTPENADALEGLTFSPVGGPGLGAAQAQQDTAADEAAQQEAEMLRTVSLGVSKVVFAGLRGLRSLIAKSTPEIREEWPDEILRDPADAAAPLLLRHMTRIALMAARNPEAAVLVGACVPLVLGYVSAVEKHSRTVEAVPVKDGA